MNHGLFRCRPFFSPPVLPHHQSSGARLRGRGATATTMGVGAQAAFIFLEESCPWQDPQRLSNPSSYILGYRKYFANKVPIVRTMV